jgi:gamma-butyrobetaine dioxygenase
VGRLLLAVNNGDDGMADQADGSPERRGRSEKNGSENAGRPAAGADDPLLLGLPAIWLRDNCACAECRDPGSRERLTSITDLSERVSVAAVHRRGHRIEIEFAPDRHHSVYDTRWLDQFRPAPVPRQRSALPAPPPQARSGTGAAAEDGRSEDAKHLWDNAVICGALPLGSWPLYQSDPAHRQACLRAVLRDGFVLLAGMPAEPGAVLAVAQTLGVVRDTEHGRVAEVRVGASPPSEASTSRPMPVSTAGPFRDPLLTVKVMGCLTAAARGGESTLVDGFFAAATLRARDPAAFAVLASTAVTFLRADDQVEMRATHPVISLDPRGRIREIRFDRSHLAPLRGAASQILAFYDAYRSFARLVDDQALTLTLALRPGHCIILDNTRVLNGRTGFVPGSATGRERHLQASWADLDGVASRLAVLERPQYN